VRNLTQKVAISVSDCTYFCKSIQIKCLRARCEVRFYYNYSIHVIAN